MFLSLQKQGASHKFGLALPSGVRYLAVPRGGDLWWIFPPFSDCFRISSISNRGGFGRIYSWFGAATEKSPESISWRGSREAEAVNGGNRLGIFVMLSWVLQISSCWRFLESAPRRTVTSHRLPGIRKTQRASRCGLLWI